MLNPSVKEAELALASPYVRPNFDRFPLRIDFPIRRAAESVFDSSHGSRLQAMRSG
ncbi:hypothetical protein [Brevibacterium zhoupengii]|uniref:hypothetical protein n=1 Tax=Brevibacterium zhoupengii TaxID=2898795 RepID=UPI001E2B0096|nr:hypothetical protein [Brevibacterium zhoupengii]